MLPTTGKDQDSDNASLELSIFKLICILGVFTSVVILLLDLIISREVISIILDATGIIIFTLYYYLVRSTKEFRLLVHPFILTIVTLLNLAWFTGGGMNIPNVLILFLVIVVTLILSPEKTRRLYAGILVCNTLLLSGLEMLHLPYSDPGIDYKDHGLLIVIFVLICSGIVMFIVGFVKMSYNKEREIIKKQNKELDIKKSEIEAQNQTLILSSKEINDQRDRIEQNNLQLREQADALRKANVVISSVNEELEKKVAERTKEIDDLFYHSSHDFRRPLATLLGLNEVARLTLDDREAQLLFNKVEETTLSMDRMLNKFLMLHSINHYKEDPNSSDFIEIMKRIENIAESRDKIQLKKVIKLRSYNIHDKRNQLLEIILINLLENAIKYSKEEIPEILLKIYDDGDNLFMVFRDNGQGIPEEFKENVFDMYFRGNMRSEGNGLGLYIVKRAVDALKAELKLQSKPMQFTQFDIQFKI